MWLLENFKWHIRLDFAALFTSILDCASSKPSFSHL